MPLLRSVLSAFFFQALGFHTVEVALERRAERRDCPLTPVKGKEVCFLFTGETFREGGQHSRRTSISPNTVADQERASRSQVTELVEVFEGLCARSMVFVRTTEVGSDKGELERGGRNASSREVAEEALARLRHFYGDKRLPEGHLVTGFGREQPLPAFSKRYPGQACDGGVLWTRPDLVFNRNMSAALRSAGQRSDSYDQASSDFPWQRFSFDEGRVLPLDLGRMLFLHPCRRKEEQETRKVFTNEGKTVTLTHWRVPDVWLWVPGRLWHDASVRIRDLRMHHNMLFFLHDIGVPEPELHDWVERNVAFLNLNSQHDSDSEKDWNPFYRMIGRPEAAFIPAENGPSKETEVHIRTVLHSITASFEF